MEIRNSVLYIMVLTIRWITAAESHGAGDSKKTSPIVAINTSMMNLIPLRGDFDIPP